MRLIITSLFFFILMCACDNVPQQQGESTQSAFRTTAPSQLYFKNMRSIYYEVEEQVDSRIELYQLKQFSEDNKRPILYPIIANNWLNDEAYIILQTNDFIHGFAQPIEIEIVEQDKLLTIATSSHQDHYLAAKSIYDALKAGHALKIKGADEISYPLFDKNLDGNHYMATIKDYLRLIEVL